MTNERDQIEFAEPHFSMCDCCGGRTTLLTRFVTRDETAFAAYFARFSDNHADHDVGILVGFGDWREDAPTSSRIAIAFRIWTTEDSYQVTLSDAAEEWDSDFLGQRLSREQALNSEWKQEAFNLSDHIVECDRPIIDYLTNC